MNKIILFSSLFVLTFLLAFPIDSVYAHPHPGHVLTNRHTHEPQTEIFPLNSMIGIEKTSTFFHSPEDNMLPWAFVE